MQLAEEMVGITKAKNELPRRLRHLENGELDRVVIVRQNSPVAVIVTVAEYDRMCQMEKLNEELQDVVDALAAVRDDDGARVSLADLKKKYGFGPQSRCAV